MTPLILFRHSIETEEEYSIARKYFDVVGSRTLVHDSLVIGRYSVLPFYKELEIDLLNHNSVLINSFQE